jgi:O-antigen/teichoic acid export membrane protein
MRPEFFGVLDVGLASLATFLVGLYAARVLAPTELGAYALCFRALFLAGVVSSHGLFWPAESLVAMSATTQRLRLLGRTLKLGLPPAFIAAVATSLWVFFAPSGLPGGALTGLTVTAVATAFLSPVQDHVRRMLHVGGVSQVAAAVSGVQLASIATALLACRDLGIGKWWVPLGSLAFGNLVSLVVGLVWVRATMPPALGTALDALPLFDIWQLGRWLLLLALLEAGSAFLAAATVAEISGAAALGYAEAARVVAQPVMVFAWGLSGVLGPRSVRAGSERDAGQGHRIERSFVLILTLAGVTSLGLLSLDWWGNPMAWLLPKAYVLPGLVALSIVAHLALGAAYSPRSELIGGGRAASMAKVDLGAGVLRTLVGASATWFNAYAVPLSLLGYGVAQSLGYRRLRQVLYLREAVRNQPETQAQNAGH